MMLRFRVVFLMTLLVFCGLPECISDDLIRPEVLEGKNLGVLWQSKLAIKEGESLEQLFILGNRVYGISSSNYMISLNREKGSVVFSRFVSETGYPLVGLEFYGDSLFSIIGNKLVEISPESGAELSATRLGFNSVCPAVRNGEYFYIAGIDNRIHALRAEDKIQVFEVAAGDGSAVSSVIAGERFVVFATKTGFCASFKPDEPKKLWQFNAVEEIAAPIVIEGSELFIASKDTNIYKLDVGSGKFVWKYQTGAQLERGPRVTENIVYQYAVGEGLTAIDKKSGKFLWTLAEGVDLLAEAEGKAYVITKNNEIAVMDNKKVKKLKLVNVGQISKYITNVADSRIYIADDIGRIVCLVPVE